jgi:HTH-type transcriptional repressor of puuD
VDELSIGEKVRALRTKFSLSQRELADKAGITNTAISSIEKNKVSPSVSTLHKILKVFDLSMVDFFQLSTLQLPSGFLIKESDQIEIGTDGVSLKLISNNRPNPKLTFLIEKYEPNTTTGKHGIRHEGEEVGIVTSGRIKVIYDGEEYNLTQGDSYVMDTNKSHEFINDTLEVTTIISAHTPGVF